MLDSKTGADFYRSIYCGRYKNDDRTLPFDRAAALLDVMTFGRALRATNPDLERRIHFAQCAIVDELIADEDAQARVASETTAHVSVTYCDTAPQAQLSRCRSAVMQYLGDTGLLYRGGGL